MKQKHYKSQKGPESRKRAQKERGRRETRKRSETAVSSGQNQRTAPKRAALARRE